MLTEITYRNSQSIVNARFLPTKHGEGYPRFSSPNYVENNRFNGFFLTASTRTAFCKGLSLEKGWDTVGQPPKYRNWCAQHALFEGKKAQ